MQDLDGRILLSASDLMRFTGCRHATRLDLLRLRGEGPKPKEDDEEAKLLQSRGDAHEAAHLDALKQAGDGVAEIPRSGDLAQDAEATRVALAEGPSVVFQGAFLWGSWGGWSDFLKRVETPSDLGAFSYEVTDAKLKRRAHPKHLLQLALYSDMLAEVQGVAPERAHLWLGGNTESTIRLERCRHYARLARARLEAFVADPAPTRPVPCADCALCRWSDHCNSVWKDEDSLFTVANVTRSQVKKLEAAGVATMEALAERAAPVRGMAEATLEKLTAQARLQHARKTGGPEIQLRPAEPGKGFDLLPQPDRGDVFYDIEGDPHYEGGLEYLHGVWHDGAFRAFWAHDHAQEEQALVDLMEFLRARLEQRPGARIHHYAPYEVTALRRLTMKYGRCEAFLDRLLRERRFVDLFAVVRGGLVASEPDYSLKSMEVFYGIAREGEVVTAGGSVVAYERWRETGEQSILDEIEEYNRVDCESTQMLRDWLVCARPQGMPWPSLDPAGTAGPPPGEKERQEQEEIDRLRAQLAASGLPEERREALFALALFHGREVKPAQWAVFDSVGKEEDDLVDSLEALGGLVAKGVADSLGRSTARIYGFPPQETKFRTGGAATIPVPEGMPASVSIEDLDPVAGEIVLKAGAKNAHLLEDKLTLHPGWPINTKGIADALRDVVDDQCGRHRYRAVDDLLAASAPRLAPSGGGDPGAGESAAGGADSAEESEPRMGADILGGADPVQGTVAAVARMDQTTLPIQGPPGAGKTYVTVRAILSLVRAGHRVGVSSNSHKAIQNVLLGCLEKRADGKFRVAHKISKEIEGYPEDCGILLTTDKNDSILAESEVVGGTAFLFSRPENAQAFDWLFVDEAGQVSLANMVAMGRAARNIVLVGDPCQLPQVIQGAHPHPADLSCLEWMLGAHATVPPDRGIFLPTTYRMHPELCRYVSEQVYDGRLKSHADTALQKVAGTSWPESGAFWVPCAHEGNAQVAEEEVAAMRAAIAELMNGTWTGKDGVARPMRERDIIVVAPYNAQVNALRRGLPEEVPVGTVDKFQGLEAPVCLVSMTASSIEEIPRGMDFLFSLNRINVAVSRAKGLALVFGSDRLREAKCETVEQMQLVNTLCALPVHESGG